MIKNLQNNDFVHSHPKELEPLEYKDGIQLILHRGHVGALEGKRTLGYEYGPPPRIPSALYDVYLQFPDAAQAQAYAGQIGKYVTEETRVKLMGVPSCIASNETAEDVLNIFRRRYPQTLCGLVEASIAKDMEPYAQRYKQALEAYRRGAAHDNKGWRL